MPKRRQSGCAAPFTGVLGLYMGLAGAAAAQVSQGNIGSTGGNVAYGQNADSGGSATQVTLSNPAGTPINEAYTGAEPQRPIDVYSIGGNGGSVASKGNDGNGNPHYGGGSGGFGGAGGSVNLSNAQSVTFSTDGNFSGGAYVVQGLSQGGNAGAGSTGSAGGAADAVTVTDQATINLEWNWSRPSDTNLGLAGVIAQSQGGYGTQSLMSGTNGGAGGFAGPVTLQQTGGAISMAEGNYDNTGPVIGRPAGTDGALVGAGEIALSNGGAGAAGYDSAAGGAGGTAGKVTLDSANADITIANPQNPPGGPGSNSLAALLAESNGGAGGNGGLGQNNNSKGGPGGGAGSVAINVTGSAAALSSIFTNGVDSPGVVAQSTGGAGGTGTTYDQYALGVRAGDGGAGGVAGQAAVTLGDYASIATVSYSSSAIAVSSVGGNGGAAGAADYSFGDVYGNAGNAGAGGAAGAVAATLNGGSGISTSGASSYGIFALSSGGAGGAGGDIDSAFNANAGNGGAGGASANTDVTVDRGASILTGGDNASAIIAQSFSGAGGAGGSANAVVSEAGNPGAGGNAGNVTVSNAGTITTLGTTARGILAQSAAGVGGSASATGGLFTVPADGAPGGSVGNVSVTNTGKIATGGQASYGIEAQSSGGSGGAAADSDSLIQIGDSDPADGTANGGYAAVVNDGLISTGGADADGILDQAIGGGGGDGGASGALVGIGGSGGAGGAGGTAEVNTGTGSTITTGGDFALGLLAQSIGGGGGTGGSADGAITVGGSGGDGGSGGTATVTTNGNIVTIGDNAYGAEAQSIGGGGGNGGDATSYSAVVGVSVGGSGGGGGIGGAVTVNANAGTDINLFGSNSIGVMAQSIGGGGGDGGAGNTITGSVGLNVAVAVGGSGGDGGNGGAATVNLSAAKLQTGLAVNNYTDPASLPDDAAATPLPIDSYGVLAQSIGGGGGNGGAATAQTFTVNLPRRPSSPIPTFNINAALGIGGSGGDGGNGSTAVVSANNGSTAVTNGNAADGVVAQSIGGGGGNGGDASAQSTLYGLKAVATITKTTNLSVTVDLANGGSGGGGGVGGTAAVAIGGTASIAGGSTVPIFNMDPANAAPVTVETLGDEADAVVVESIGGGGGNAGFGSGSTQNFNSAATALTLDISVGASGGTGGNGGSASVGLGPDATVETKGSSADAVYVDSIGGGGGTSQGGSYTIGLPSFTNVAKGLAGYLKDTTGFKVATFFPGVGTPISLKIHAGGTGPAGGDGGPVTVDSAALVSTLGDDAVGIFGQSIGGGGGLAGSAGSDGSADNPYTIAGSIRTGVNEIASYVTAVAGLIDSAGKVGAGFLAAIKTALPAVKINLSFGATGGAGGNGGPVAINVTGGSVTTLGDYAEGIFGQSVGGGGGEGGAAGAGGATGLGTFQSVNVNLALGGSGGSGGLGGPVDILVDGNTNITTGSMANGVSSSGFAAYGVLGQSVGGGGGTAGSAQTFPNAGYLSLGGSGSLSSGAGSAGGAVNFTTNSNTPNLGYANITTYGTAAHALVLQSIGGGGGIVGAGASLAIAPFAVGNFVDNGDNQATVSLTDGGAQGANGAGGAVSLTNAAVKIATYGQDSYGILAQSIGGGGGLIAAIPSDAEQNPLATPAVYKLGGQTSNPANGGSVTIAPNYNLTISTSGQGASAIVAQSIGGGGGIDGYAENPANPDGPVNLAFNPTGQGVTNGNGGAVSITLPKGSDILTTGASAFGILAQSIGAGGGLEASADGTTMLAGTSGAAGSNGAGGNITINQDGVLETTGAGAVGIFAQSVGQTSHGNSPSGTVDIYVNGTVEGGSGAGTGISVDTDSVFDVLNVNPGGSVSALSNVAIVNNGSGILTVNNYGTVTGGLNLVSDGTVSSFNNQPGGILVSTGASEYAVVNNAGLIETNYTGQLINSSITQNFTQAGTGTYQTHIDFDNANAEVLNVSGAATLAGAIAPVLVGNTDAAGENRPVTVLYAGGGVSNFGIATVYNPIATYALTTSSNNVQVSLTSVNFAAAAAALSKAQTAVAGHLNEVFIAGTSPALSPLVNQLLNTAATNLPSYRTQLSALSPGASLGVAARGEADAQAFGNALMSCPGYADGSPVLQEQSCFWARGIGRAATESAGGGVSGFKLDEAGFLIGGQKEVSSGWFVGAAGGYGESWLQSDDGFDKVNGNSGSFGLVLKHEIGNWLLAAAAYGTYGDYAASRYIDVPNFTALAKSSPSTGGGGVRLRAAYTMTLGDFYLRPSLNLDNIYLETPSYRETVADGLGLQYQSAGHDIFAATPTLEVGQRILLPRGHSVRLYASAGLSLLSANQWTQDARLENAPSAAAGFDAAVPIDNVVGHLQVGTQLYSQGPFELRGQYDGEISHHITSHAGTFTLSYRFW